MFTSPKSVLIDSGTLSHEMLVRLEQQLQMEGASALPELTSVTVDGLLEFACYVDFCYRNSETVELSRLHKLGRVHPLLADVARDLRRRSSNTPKSGRSVFEPRDFEWYFLTYSLSEGAGNNHDNSEEEDELTASYFYQRFKSAMTRHGFSTQIALAITKTFSEMCDNVFQHSGNSETSPASGLAAYHVQDGWSTYSVADTGRGALASLVTNPKWSELQDEIGALQAVATKKASRRHDWVEGGGFRQVFKALVDFNGLLRLRSGNASLTITGTDTSRNGSSVTFCL